MDPDPEDRGGGLRVRVAWVAPEGVREVPVEVPAGACVRDALAAAKAPTGSGHFGVFNRERPLDWRLRDGDRVEVYRALKVDPKEARRLRAKARA